MTTQALTLEATTSGGENEYSRRLNVSLSEAQYQLIEVVLQTWALDGENPNCLRQGGLARTLQRPTA
jgi:hypothetical protein